MVSSFIPGKLYRCHATGLVVFALATTEVSVWEIFPPGPKGQVWLHYVDGTGRRDLWLVYPHEFDEVLPEI